MSADFCEVLHVDLASPAAAVAPQAQPGAERVYVMFWWNALPLGVRAFTADELPLCREARLRLAAGLGAEQLEARDRALGPVLQATQEGRPRHALTLEGAVGVGELAARLDALAAAPAPEAAEVSVIVCTRDRPEDLARCLDALARQQASPGEIIVVDNAASRSAQSVCAGQAGVRYVHEPRPGLSVARNTGARAARGAVIAYTDDDVEAHPGWTAEIARPFADPTVDAVTGLVFPARLRTQAQHYFQFALGGFGSGCQPVLFGPAFFAETAPRGAQVWRVGAGANMAFRRAALETLGLFDERLGAGAAGCSEDSEMWYRLLAAGGACLYEPRALVFHHHRAEWGELRRQMRAYMRGHVAALFVQYDRHRHAGNLKRIFWQLPSYLLGVGVRSALEGHPQRLSIWWEETVGWMAGLSYGWRARWRRDNALPQLAGPAVHRSAA